MNSPFKLLEPYTFEDSSYFFGRKKEVIQLGDLLNHSKFVLLYGASGTGKTSLIQCGLRGMYSPRDWYPLFIRRNKNFIATLHASLDQEYLKWANTVEELQDFNFQGQSLRDKIKCLFTWSCRPIFLILDQFEEIFTLSAEREQEVEVFFAELLNLDLFNEDLFCKIIIICREEYLAHFYNFEKKVPFLFENRFRLEKMRNEQMLECIRGVIGADYSNRGYLNMQLAEALDQVILEKIESPRGDIELTELQIYLDRLYRKDLQRRQKEKLDRNYVLFDEALLGKEKLRDVLNDFLNEQLAKIKVDTRLKKEDYSLSLAILFKFISSEGTKKNLSFKELVDNFSSGTQVFSIFQLQQCLDQLLAPEIKLLNRLNFVNAEEERYEIMHDRMAECIAKRFSEKEAKYREATATLESRFKRFQELSVGEQPENAPEYLSKGDLILIDEALNLKVIATAKKAFIQQSKDFHALQEREKTRRRNNLRIAATLGIFVLFVAAWNTYAVYKNNQIRQLVFRAKLKERENPGHANAILDSALAVEPTSDLAIQARKELWLNHQFYYQRKKYAGPINTLSSFKNQRTTFLGIETKILQIDAAGKAVDSIDLDSQVLAMRADDQGGGLYWVEESNVVYYWHPASGKIRLGVLEDALYGIDFHEGKNLLALVDALGRLYLWKDQKWIKKGRTTFPKLYSGQPKAYPDNTLAFNRQGDRLICAGDARGALLFDLKEDQVQKLLPLHLRTILAVDYSPVNDEVLTCSRDGQVFVWDLQAGIAAAPRLVPQFSYLKQGMRINLGKFSPNGQLIALGYTNHLMEIWNHHKNNAGQYYGHQDRVIGASWFAHSKILLSASMDSSLIWWKKASRANRTYGPLSFGIEGLCYVPERNELFIANGTGIKDNQLKYKNPDLVPQYPTEPQDVYRWKVGKKPKLIGKKAIQLAGIRKIISIDEGKQLVMCSESSELFFWDLDKDSLYQHSTNSGTIQDICQIDAKHFAILGEDGIEIWNSQGKRERKILPPQGGGLSCIAWNPHNHKLYLGRYNGESKTGLLVEADGRWKPIPGYPIIVTSIAISRDGQKLAVGTSDNKIYWAKTQKLLKFQTIAFSKHSTDGQEEAYDLAFSPDGSKLAVATKGGKFILLQLKKGYEQMVLGDMDDIGMYRLVFAPDGRSVYCGGGDGSVYQYIIP